MSSLGDHLERHSIAELRDMARIYSKLGMEDKSAELTRLAEELDAGLSKGGHLPYITSQTSSPGSFE